MFSARAPWLALALLCAGVVATIMVVGRDLTTFYYDEWNFVLNRSGREIDVFLAPHNEHLSAWPVLVFKALYELVGLAPYWPYRLAVALTVAACAALTYAVARPRIGAGWALAPAAMVALAGYGSQDLLWPFQVGFDTAVGAGAGAIVCLDRGTRRADALAAALVLLALASASVGVAVLAAAVVHVVANADRARRAAIVLAAPVLLYGAWYLGYGAAAAEPENIVRIPGFVAGSAGHSTAALLGLGGDWAWPAGVALAALVLRRALRRCAPWQPLAVAAALPLAFWITVALGRADQEEPSQDRYLFPGAVFVALLACEALRGMRAPRLAVAPVVLVVVASTVSDVGGLGDQARFIDERFTSYVRAEVAAVDLAMRAGPVADEVHFSPARAPDLIVGPYRDVVAIYGSPVPDPVAALRASGEDQRRSADNVYAAVAGGVVNAVAAPGPPADEPPRVLRGDRVRAAKSGACLTLAPYVRGSSVDLELPAGGIAMRTPGPGRVGVHMGRFAQGISVITNGLDANVWGMLAMRSDDWPGRWRVRLVLNARTRVCAVAPH